MSTIAAPQIEHKTSTIPMWKVLFHNDDKTSFEFVITALHMFFGKTVQAAAEMAMEVHEKGIGLAGIYTLEVAELKLDQTVSAARTRGFPLVLTLEKA